MKPGAGFAAQRRGDRPGGAAPVAIVARTNGATMATPRGIFSKRKDRVG